MLFNYLTTNVIYNIVIKTLELGTKCRPELCAEHTTNCINQDSEATKAHWIVEKLGRYRKEKAIYISYTNS